MDRQAWTRWRPTVRQRWWLAGGAAFVLVVALTWALWPASEPDPPPRAREYLDYTACLLTGDRGIADPQAAPVWAGLQDASLATRAKVQYLAVTGPQTAENGVPFLSSLVQGACDVIFAAGAAPVGAVGQGAPKFPGATFVAVGKAAPAGNVTVLDDSSAARVRADVSRLLTDKVRAAAD